MRHCATSRKVAGLISVEVFEIVHGLNPVGHTMALGSTQPVREMTTRGVKAAGT